MNDLVTFLVDLRLLFFLIGLALVIVNYVGGEVQWLMELNQL